jgi:HAD superfamily hydrolase (TIGR01459 family)
VSRRDDAALHAELRGLRDWLLCDALPLWAEAGWDPVQRQFQERLGPDLTPDRAAPRRLMVQARQISVFAAAPVDGGPARALIAAERMVELYHQRDGGGGWIFSVDGRGAPVRRDRDLYAHAFALYALAAVLPLAPNAGFRGVADETLAFLDDEMALPAGGYAESWEGAGELRRQDPHMHLIEALQELFVATGDGAFLARAGSLVELALRRFLDPGTGALREVFHADWSVHPAPGAGRVEPGHHFEWVCLLRRQHALSGSAAAADTAANRLLAFAIAHGVDHVSGRVVDALDERGSVHCATSRLWPHCEAVRCLVLEAERGSGRVAGLATVLIRRLRADYLRPALCGGWVDRLDERDRPVPGAIPASSLHHIWQAFREAWRVTGEAPTPTVDPVPPARALGERSARLAVLAAGHDAFLIDQYGVLHDGASIYPGVLDSLRRLRAQGAAVAVVTNSSKSSTQSRARLVHLGFPPGLFDAVVTAGDLGRAELARRAGGASTVYVVARDDDRSYLAGLALREVTDAGAADLILIAGSRAPAITLAEYMRRLGGAAARGTPALCINRDRLMVTPAGCFPGAGLIAERYAALGAPVCWIGKPHPEIFAAARLALGSPPAARTLVMGDSLEHDIAGARAAGLGSALVCSGIAAGAAGLCAGDDGPTWILPDMTW